MTTTKASLSGFPSYIKDPGSYYDGVDLPHRLITRNAVVFDRRTRRTLQQQHLANRMHHRYVLLRVLSTPGVVSVDGQSLKLNVGDALLVNPYQFHHYIDLESDQLRWLFITFDLVQGESSLEGLSYRRLQPDEQAHALWRELVNLWVSDDSNRRAEVLPVLDRLLARLQLTTAVRAPVADEVQLDSKNAWIAEIEALIIQSVREGWTLKAVAQRAGFSERHLRDRFEQQTGLSLRDYRSNYQFHTAISLMRDDTRSLSEIAELSGFNSQSVFTRFIRRMADRTPRELYRQVREGRYEPS